MSDLLIDTMISNLVMSLYVLLFGFVGGTARYIHELGVKNKPFVFVRWFITTFIGAFIAVIAGFTCSHFKLSEELTYAIVSLCAVSGKEIMEELPAIAQKISERTKELIQSKGKKG